MDIVIVKGVFNGSCINNPTCIAFSIHGVFINIEVSYLIISATCILNGEPLRSSE